MRAFRLSLLIAVSTAAFEAVAVAQTSPPPTDYQQPPPGYQQQPPPGYQQQPPPGYQQQPPPGYQQQPPPGYQQQPPPGYQQQPPPGYYQQPPTAYQPPPGYAAPPPPPPPGRHGMLLLPYIGMESHQGNTGVGLGPGFVVGGILGGRLGPNFSINGELRFDVLNPSNAQSGVDVTAIEVDFAASPFFHAPFPKGEFIVGPKFGFFGGAQQVSYGGVQGDSYSASGLVYGFNSGVFFDVGPRTALGGMLTLAIRDATTQCYTPAGGAEQCSSSGNYAAEKVLGFQFAALF